MSARIKYGMEDAQLVDECRMELAAARAVPGAGTNLILEPHADQTLMHVVVKQGGCTAGQHKYVEQIIRHATAVVEERWLRCVECGQTRRG